MKNVQPRKYINGTILRSVQKLYLHIFKLASTNCDSGKTRLYKQITNFCLILNTGQQLTVMSLQSVYIQFANRE